MDFEICYGNTLALTIGVDNYHLKSTDLLIFSISKRVNGTTLKRVETRSFQDGKAQIFLTSEEMREFEVGTYYYDVLVILEGGFTKTIIPPSKLIIKGVVTRHDD